MYDQMDSNQIKLYDLYIPLEYKILSIFLIVGCIFSRPMILGNLFAPFGLIIIFLICLVELIRNRFIILKSKNLNILMSSLLLFLYCGFQSAILGSDRLFDGLQTLVYLIVCSISFYVIFSNIFIKTGFIRLLYKLLCFFSLSCVISNILMFVLGWDTIHIFDFDYDYFVDAVIYFPFTPTYGEMSFNGIVFRRLLGFARESGIMQMFYCWGFYNVEKYCRNTKIVKILMLVGVACCLSTAGFIVFFISLLFYFDLKNLFNFKTIFIIVSLLGLLYILFFAEGTSIKTRSIRTITDRTNSISNSFEVFFENPIFGKGFYDSLNSNEEQIGINMISSLGQIGITGFILWINIYFITFINSKDKKFFLCSMSPILITALGSQPLFTAPIAYIFNYFDYD